MPSFDVVTIGHSNMAAGHFIAMLQTADVTAVADVRSIPASRYFPWFSKKKLAARLADANIAYAPMGETLGGRPRDARLYRDGIADYEAMAMEPQFRASLDRLVADAAHARICLMCAEREPLDCHRFLLVARRLAERGLKIGHILDDGSIEPHTVTEGRLLGLDRHGQSEDCDLFTPGQSDGLAAAYRRRARAVAYRQTGATGHAAENR